VSDLPQEAAQAHFADGTGINDPGTGTTTFALDSSPVTLRRTGASCRHRQRSW